ncbi:Gfo/Idh/MocA family protein [Naumannella halotolerans]|uniref:Putative dehydrogenase n=1 Tax=Naumannella halotolerans TaxID=993414 RepID=A0A4R7J7B7_9ACTN|nr:Gfo/Idh/MocA family oxidoreductase [Naumannella halotolerans]TDT33330.1 putative dehydrogenase [Naumannella halotolerans]
MQHSSPQATVSGSLGIGMVGYAFMGRAHSQGWLGAREFFSPPLWPQLRTVAGRNRAGAQELADHFGWGGVTTDWQDLLSDDGIGLVDICTPGDTHAEIAIAALEAGRHVLVEKPMANTVAEAERMAAAAERAAARGQIAMVGFTYRRVPAVQLARQIVAEGKLGTIRLIRAEYLQDWLVDSAAPFTWRSDRELAGSGALGDIGAHAIDLAQFVSGELITEVSGLLDTAVATRTDAEGVAQEVTVDDTAAFLTRFQGGAVGNFTATRMATGRKNSLRLEISGELGAISFDLEDLNVLQLQDTSEGDRAGFRRIDVTEPSHRYLSGWWPPGHALGYQHGFTHQALDLLNGIAAGENPRPTFADALGVQRVLQSVEDSARDRSWVAVDQLARTDN